MKSEYIEFHASVDNKRSACNYFRSQMHTVGGTEGFPPLGQRVLRSERLTATIASSEILNNFDARDVVF